MPAVTSDAPPTNLPRTNTAGTVCEAGTAMGRRTWQLAGERCPDQCQLPRGRPRSTTGATTRLLPACCSAHRVVKLRLDLCLDVLTELAGIVQLHGPDHASVVRHVPQLLDSLVAVGAVALRPGARGGRTARLSVTPAGRGDVEARPQVAQPKCKAAAPPLWHFPGASAGHLHATPSPWRTQTRGAG